MMDISRGIVEAPYLLNNLTSTFTSKSWSQLGRENDSSIIELLRNLK